MIRKKFAGALSILSLVALVLAAGGCAHGRRSHSQTASATRANQSTQPAGPVYGPDQPYGPEAPPKPPTFGPVFEAARPVVLVLGPGLARGYAYTGVIRALSDAKIKVGAIVGTEMGALLGALYAETGSVNQFEWGIQRFRANVFDGQEGLISRLLSENPARSLDSSLKKVFGNSDLSSTKIPLRILVQPAGQGAKLYDKGPLRKIVRAALGNVDGFPPVNLDQIPTGSAGAVRPFDVEDAKALGIGPVIAVDVLDPKQSDLYPELKEADLILRPDVHLIGLQDFKKRTDAVFAGKTATEEHLQDIRRIVGGEIP